MTTDSAILQARKAALALVAARAEGATVCPSEVARVLAAECGKPADWRSAMPVVHAAVDQMLSEG
ncbi:hypothetical protein BH10PSE1_BH10PSE1_24710 [soil metagenome]